MRAKSPYLLALLCGLLPTMMLAAEVTLTPLSPLDLSYIEQQSQGIDELAARRLGRHLRGDLSDLALLQTILDRQLIKEDDEAGLQALGIVLGGVLASEHALEWVIYRDSQGRSRALSIGRGKQCLFPATMIARRARVGQTVDVRAIYASAGETIKKVRSSGVRPY